MRDNSYKNLPPLERRPDGSLYQRLAASETAEIRDMALTMLISYARNRGDFAKAEELIQALPSSAIDKEEQLAILYQQQKRKDAQKIW